MSDSISNVRGSAIHRIIQCYGYTEFKEIIFETTEKAISDEQASVSTKVQSSTSAAITQNLCYQQGLSRPFFVKCCRMVRKAKATEKFVSVTFV